MLVLSTLSLNSIFLVCQQRVYMSPLPNTILDALKPFEKELMLKGSILSSVHTALFHQSSLSPTLSSSEVIHPSEIEKDHHFNQTDLDSERKTTLEGTGPETSKEIPALNLSPDESFDDFDDFELDDSSVQELSADASLDDSLIDDSLNIPVSDEQLEEVENVFKQGLKELEAEEAEEAEEEYEDLKVIPTPPPQPKGQNWATLLEQPQHEFWQKKLSS
jgi:hypothetical protein